MTFASPPEKTPAQGRALVYPIYKGTYERQAPGKLSGSREKSGEYGASHKT
jgi:hypothetical protein